MFDYSGLLGLFVFIIIGFILTKTNLLKEDSINSMPAVLLNIAYPAMIINSITNVDVRSLANESLIIVISTLLITLLLYFAGRLIARKFFGNERKPLVLLLLGVGNIVYVVLPVIKVLYGETGVYYAMLHATAQDVLIWSFYFHYFASRAGQEGLKLRHMFSPCFFALFAALVISVIGFKMPPAASGIISSLAAMTIPLALIYLGGVLAGFGGWRNLLPDLETIVISVFKVLILPLIVYGSLSIFSVRNELCILIGLFFAAPATIMSTVWAKEYGCDYRFSIKSLFFSTLVFFIAAIVFFVFNGVERMSL